MKPMQKCLKPAVFLLTSRRRFHENEPTSHLIYELSELVPKDFMDSISSFKSSSTQHDDNFVNYRPVYFKTDHKAVYVLGRGYLVIDRSPQVAPALKHTRLYRLF